jgi:hypothetical protein
METHGEMLCDFLRSFSLRLGGKLLFGI